MRQKSASSTARPPISHAGGSYSAFGPTPRYSASGALESVAHGLAGSGLIDGTWGNVKGTGALVGVLNQLRGTEQIQTPYWQDPWIFAAIYRIAEAASAARIRFFQDRSPDSEPISDDDPLYEFFRRPHPALSYNRWLRHMTTMWWIYGETPLALRRGPGTDWITEPGGADLVRGLKGKRRERLQLWPVKPDCAELLYDESLSPSAWRVNVASHERYIDIPADAVAHLYAPDPMDVLLSRGMGRLEAALRTADIDWSAERFAEADVRTGGVPNIVLIAKGASEEQAKELAEQIEKKHQVPNQHGKAMVLRGKEYEVLFPGHTAKEMAWVELRRWNREAKIAVMGANPAWLGITDDVNRANGENGRRNVWEDTIGPFLEMYAGEMENEVLPMFGDRYAEMSIKFDTSHITALREDANEAAARAKLYFEAFPVTMREAFDLAGIELDEDIEGADERKPAPQPPAMPGTQPDDQDQPVAPQAQSFALFEKDEHDTGRRETWGVFAEQTMAAEAKIKKRTLRVLSGYVDKAMALARDLAQEGKTFAWSGAVQHDISEDELRLLLPDIGPWQERLADALRPVLADVLAYQTWYIAQSVGAEALVTAADPFASAFLATKEVNIRETLATLRTAVKNVLDRALTSGEAIGSTADQIRQVLELYRTDLKVMQDSLGSRAELIARTETTSVANGARVMEAKAQGIVEGRWITGSNPRESHADLDGQRAVVGEVFVGKSGASYNLRHPGDPEADVSQLANCNCAWAPTARGAQAIAGGQAA